MPAICDVALAFCPMSEADVALASVPDVVALGAVVLGSELELDVLDELPALVPDGMLLLLSLGWLLLEAAPALLSLGWLLVELDCA